MIRVVIVESPFAAPTPEGLERNARYLDACILDCLRRGETPYASHRMLTGALRDAVPEEREQGIKAGFDMREALSNAGGTSVVTAIYLDLGMSDGMRRGVEHSDELDIACDHRRLGGEWAAK